VSCINKYSTDVGLVAGSRRKLFMQLAIFVDQKKKIFKNFSAFSVLRKNVPLSVKIFGPLTMTLVILQKRLKIDYLKSLLR
jgi:hypothetical protein